MRESRGDGEDRGDAGDGGEITCLPSPSSSPSPPSRLSELYFFRKLSLIGGFPPQVRESQIIRSLRISGLSRKSQYSSKTDRKIFHALSFQRKK
jgi:hypothetical protein